MSDFNDFLLEQANLKEDAEDDLQDLQDRQERREEEDLDKKVYKFTERDGFTSYLVSGSLLDAVKALGPDLDPVKMEEIDPTEEDPETESGKRQLNRAIDRMHGYNPY